MAHESKCSVARRSRLDDIEGTRPIGCWNGTRRVNYEPIDFVTLKNGSISFSPDAKFFAMEINWKNFVRREELQAGND